LSGTGKLTGGVLFDVTFSNLLYNYIIFLMMATYNQNMQEKK
jgi:hypothetical protein